MGAIPGLLGINGGANGTGFSGPENAQILQGVNTGDARWQYDQATAGVQQQQRLLEALQMQGGLQNQNAQYGNLNNIAGQQLQTGNLYGNLWSGIGPNPAQRQLAQNTAANVANTGAMMAGQRGASQNVGLVGRNAAREGANQQQNAIGQAATLQAQQQIQGLQGMAQQQAAAGQTYQSAGNIAANQAANQVGQTNAITSAHQANYGNVLNALAAYNNANIGMQSNINNVNGQLANTTMQAQSGLIGGMMQAGASAAKMGGGGMAEGGEVTEDMKPETQVEMAPPSESVQSEPLEQEDMPQPQVASGDQPDPASGDFGEFETGVENEGAFSAQTPTFGPNGGVAALVKGAAGETSAYGGEIKKRYAEGGDVYQGQSDFGRYATGATMGSVPDVSTPSFAVNAGASSFAKGADKGAGASASQAASSGAQTSGAGAAGSTAASGAGGAGGATTSGLASGAMSGLGGLGMARGGNARKDLRSGGHVKAAGPSQKAVKSGDDYSNDKIPAILSEHEIVLPRSVTLSEDPVSEAARFVQAVLAKRRK